MEYVDAPPPNRRRTRAPWRDNVEELKGNPGKWAIVHTYEGSQKAYVDAARLRTEGFLAEGRMIAGVSYLYACWPDTAA